MADVTAIRGEEVAPLLRLVRERGPVRRGRRVEGVDRQPDDHRHDDEEDEQASEPRHQRRDQHALARVALPAAWNLGNCPVAPARPVVALAHQPATGGGAIASATLRVSRRRRSAVFVKTVMPMFTIWTIPERTIIAPKIPRAM